MHELIKWSNRLLGIGVIGLFAFNMVYVLNTKQPPAYDGLWWAIGLTILQLGGGLIQLGRLKGGIFDYRYQPFLTLALLMLGVGVEIYIWASVVNGFVIPHLTPLYVVLGYWLAFYGEIVVEGMARQLGPDGILHQSYKSPEQKLREENEQLRSDMQQLIATFQGATAAPSSPTNPTSPSSEESDVARLSAAIDPGMSLVRSTNGNGKHRETPEVS